MGDFVRLNAKGCGLPPQPVNRPGTPGVCAWALTLQPFIFTNYFNLIRLGITTMPTIFAG